MTDDRKLIADVLEHDEKATAEPWHAHHYEGGGWSVDGHRRGLATGDWCESDADLIAAYRTAAPELARRLAALLDALFDPENTRCALCGVKIDQRHIRAAYARNLEKHK